MSKKPPRVAIVCDGEHWFTRHIAWTVHNTVDCDEMVYHCDRPIGGPYKSVGEAVRALKRRYSSLARRPARK
jgi:hypothetical protein